MQSEQPARIRSACQQVAALTVEGVTGAGGPQRYSFTDLKERVRGMIFLAQRLESCDFDNIPDERLAKVAASVDQTYAALVGMQSYCQNQGGGQNRDNVHNRVVAAHTGFYDEVWPIIAFSAARGSDLQELERQTLDVRDRMLALEKEGAAVLDALKQFSIKDTVSKQADFFDKQAKNHRTGGMLWMGLVVGVAALITVLAILTMRYPPPSPASTLELVSQWLPRLAIASLLFWGVTLCARNYRAHRHNEVINQHRALSLKTFNVFVTATDDSTVKAAVLAQAASTVFSTVPSGYAPEQADPLPHATAVELLQRIGPK